MFRYILNKKSPLLGNEKYLAMLCDCSLQEYQDNKILFLAIPRVTLLMVSKIKKNR